MKKSANGNMYEIALDEAWELFSAQLDGAHSALVCVVSTHSLDERSRTALNKSAEALGYGKEGCTFATVEDLDGPALFLMLEGLDPLCLVATDQTAAAALQSAYRRDIPLNEAGRVLGRTVVTFTSFSKMLDDGQDKQIAWALLKRLPRLGATS